MTNAKLKDMQKEKLQSGTVLDKLGCLVLQFQSINDDFILVIITLIKCPFLTLGNQDCLPSIVIITPSLHVISIFIPCDHFLLCMSLHSHLFSPFPKGEHSLGIQW